MVALYLAFIFLIGYSLLLSSASEVFEATITLKFFDDALFGRGGLHNLVMLMEYFAVALFA